MSAVKSHATCTTTTRSCSDFHITSDNVVLSQSLMQQYWPRDDSTVYENAMCAKIETLKATWNLCCPIYRDL